MRVKVLRSRYVSSRFVFRRRDVWLDQVSGR